MELPSFFLTVYVFQKFGHQGGKLYLELIFYRGLHQIRGAFDPLNSDNSSNQLSSKHVIDLARTNQQLTDAIKYRLLPSHVTAALSNKIEPDWHDYLTKAEAHAREVIDL